MAHNARTEKLASGSVPAPGTSDRTGGVDSALEWLWHTLISMRLALILMLLFAALTLVGALVIQAPQGVMDDPQAKADWLAGVRPRFGPWTDLMDQLQVFSIFSSVWLRVIGALLAASLIACTVQRIPGTWRAMRRPNVNVGQPFFEHAPQHDSMTFHRPVDEVLETTRATMKRRGYRTLVADDGTVHLYFDRNRWAPWSGLIAHASIVVILAGALIGSMWGFRESQFLLAEGATAAVPKVAGATITLNSFSDTYDPRTGQPLDYVSDVTVTRDGAVVVQQQVRVNEPLRYGGVSFYQSFFGPAAVVTVKDAEGATLLSEGVPLAWSINDGANKVGTFTLPEQNLVVYLVATSGTADPNVKPGQLAFELYRADTGDPITQKTADQGAPTEIEGLTFTFDREAKYTGLSVANDPGTPIVWLGCLLLVAGFAVRLYVPYRRIWGRLAARPDGGSSLAIATVGRRDSSLDAEFTSIVTDIRRAVAGRAES